MRRRRFINIVAAHAVGLPLAKLFGVGKDEQNLLPVRWQGYTLGAEGRFTLYAETPSEANQVLEVCFKEIRRLEGIFSLYEKESELSRLNRDGHLDSPSGDWYPLLEAAGKAHRMTEGLFDPTIQPYWLSYQEHFEKYPDATTGPDVNDLKAVKEAVGWRHLHYDKTSIRLDRPNACLTLNGIAQGFITDRITDLLKEAGFTRVLVELGETRALGAHPTGRSWKIGIKNAAAPDEIAEVIDLEDSAMATSGGYGSPFSKSMSVNHLIHPLNGDTESPWKSLSVITSTATEADALSTGLSLATKEVLRRFELNFPDIRLLKQA